MKVAVIGANGQVGREVSLFLSVMNVEVVAISRTELGGIFLERCGVACRYGSISDECDAKRLLEGCDIVADFAHPRGLPYKIREAVSLNVNNIVKFAPEGAPYVYMSTISAFGMRHEDSKMKNHFLAHTTYAADKRYLERHVLSHQNTRDIYVLRLSQVHGELQKVSQQFIDEVVEGDIALPFHEDTSSYTVFCYSIAEAIINICSGKERPGIYTVVSTPYWSWGDVYRYWASRQGIQVNLLASAKKNDESTKSRFLRNAGKLLAKPVIDLGVKYRMLVLNYVFFGFPMIQEKMQAIHLKRKAASEISKGKPVKARRKFQVGTIPGKTLVSLSDSKLTMQERTAEVRRIIDAAIPIFDENDDATHEQRGEDA